MDQFRRVSADPQPFSFSSSQHWEGNDGKWSTFIIRVSNPAQTFRVLVSTSGQETWVPLPEGCLPSDPPDCDDLRGVQDFRNGPSRGFKINQVRIFHELLWLLDLY